MIDEADILWEIEAEHLREAEFLFETREAVLEAPHYTLDEVGVGPEARLLAQLDGLVVGGPLVGERLLLGTLTEAEDDDYEKVAAATLALFSEPDRTLCMRALVCLDDGESRQARGIIRALQLIRPTWVDDWIMQTMSSCRPMGLAARLDVWAGGSVLPGPWLRACLASDELAVARAAARLARYSPDPEVLTALAPLAHAENAELRRITLESALCRHMPGAWESAVYWAFAADESPFRREALVWVALAGDGGVRSRLLARLDESEGRADLLWALGFAGSPAAVDGCIELLADEELGRLAGEVVCAIAGLSLEDDRYWLDPPDDDPDETLPPLEDDDLDAELLPPPEASLPIPNPETIATWWAARRGDFDPTLRYLSGCPLDGGALLTGLRSGPMRRRHALAFELAVRTAGTSFVDTRALCLTQHVQINGLPEFERLDFQRGLPFR